MDTGAGLRELVSFGFSAASGAARLLFKRRHVIPRTPRRGYRARYLPTLNIIQPAHAAAPFIARYQASGQAALTTDIIVLGRD
jgi:hypothetical protein